MELIFVEHVVQVNAVQANSFPWSYVVIRIMVVGPVILVVTPRNTYQKRVIMVGIENAMTVPLVLLGSSLLPPVILLRLAMIPSVTIAVPVRVVLINTSLYLLVRAFLMAVKPVPCVMPDRFKQLRVRRVLTQYAQHVLVVPGLTVLVEHLSVSHVLLKNTVLVDLLTPKIV